MMKSTSYDFLAADRQRHRMGSIAVKDARSRDGCLSRKTEFNLRLLSDTEESVKTFGGIRCRKLERKA
jgi:hypothetical protein